MNRTQSNCCHAIRRVASSLEATSELWRDLGAPKISLTALQRSRRCYEIAAELGSLHEPTPTEMCDLLYHVIDIGQIELEVYWAWPVASFPELLTSPRKVLAQSITAVKQAHTSLLADTQKIEIDPPPQNTKKRKP